MKFIPTILCAGVSSHLWFVSHEMPPKPFIRLADGQNLLQKAWLRGALLLQAVETMTVTNREFFSKSEMNTAKSQISPLTPPTHLP